MTEATMVLCADGVERPESGCLQDYDCAWHPAEECEVLADGCYAHRDDDNVITRGDGELDLLDACTYVPNEDAYYNDDDVCRCDWCDDFELCAETHETGGGSTICRTCEGECAFSCDCCGHLYHIDESVGRNDSLYCEDCAPSRNVLPYSDKSVNYFRSESRCKLLYGIELEVESDDGDADYGAVLARRKLNESYCVFKEDGSLGDGGFEIVTRPDSMAVHKREWQAFFDDGPGGYLSSWDTGRCGMHVHVSRAGLTQLQLGKMLCFLNNPSNDRFVRKIAGRSGDEWARKSPKKVTDINKPDERYVALNIGCRTAEVRIFKGTLKHTSFLKNLEFVEALVKWCAPANVCIKDSMSCDAFASWVDRKEFPNLYCFLKEKGLIK